MNERIREIALQAGDYTNAVYTVPVRSKTPGKIWEDGHIGWHEQFNEKFAELIVRECASVVDYYHTRNEPISGRNIKQHFGVEE